MIDQYRAIKKNRAYQYVADFLNPFTVEKSNKHHLNQAVKINITGG